MGRRWVRAPAAQASNSGLTRSSWRTWPHRKLPRVDGALTTLPMARAVPLVRNTSASSMQSPPASADATRVIILSPVFARPGASPRSRCRSTSWDRPRRRARVDGRISPALATRGDRQRRFGCGRGGGVAASVGCSFSGTGFVLQNHYPRYRGAPSCRSRSLTRRPPSVDSG